MKIKKSQNIWENTIKHVPLHKLKPHPLNKVYFSVAAPKTVNSLQESIQTHGIYDPIKVTRAGV